MEGTEIGVFHTSHLTPFNGDQTTTPIKPRRAFRLRNQKPKPNFSNLIESTPKETLSQATSDECMNVHTKSGRTIRKPVRFPK